MNAALIRLWRASAPLQLTWEPTHATEPVRVMTDTDPVQAVAEALRKSRMTWGTHSDRWADAEWQGEFWTEVAEAAVAAARPLIEAQALRKALREAERAIRDVRHSGDPGPVIDDLTGEGGWALGMNRAASIVRLQAEIAERGESS